MVETSKNFSNRFLSNLKVFHECSRKFYEIKYTKYLIFQYNQCVVFYEWYRIYVIYNTVFQVWEFCQSFTQLKFCYTLLFWPLVFFLLNPGFNIFYITLLTVSLTIVSYKYTISLLLSPPPFHFPVLFIKIRSLIVLGSVSLIRWYIPNRLFPSSLSRLWYQLPTKEKRVPTNFWLFLLGHF